MTGRAHDADYPSTDEGAAPVVVAVLTAAGSGSRLGAGGPKALVEVAGESLLRRSVRGLLASGVVSYVVVTAPPDDVSRFAAEVADLPREPHEQGAEARRSQGSLRGGAESRVSIVAGSSVSRQASVALGLRAALEQCPEAQVVLVHDAARALTPPEVVRRVVQAVREGYEAVVPALAVTDTIKEVAAVSAEDEGGAHVERVVGTPERSRMRAVQTPQGFAREVLVRAHEHGAGRSSDESLAASDDAGLVEAAGGRVHVVAGDAMSLKVTTPLDLALVEVILSGAQAGSLATSL